MSNKIINDENVAKYISRKINFKLTICSKHKFRALCSYKEELILQRLCFIHPCDQQLWFLKLLALYYSNPIHSILYSNIWLQFIKECSLNISLTRSQGKDKNYRV